MSYRIWRWSEWPTRTTYALTTSLSTTPEIIYDKAATGTIHIPTGSSITSLQFYGAPYTLNSDPDKGPNQYTYVPFYDLTGTSGSPGGNLVIVYVAAPGCYQIPAMCAGSRGLKIVTNANGSVDISLKG